MSAEMDALVKSATDRLESLEGALDGLNRIRGAATSADGLVTAEVDGGGALVGLYLQEAITNRPANEVGQLITQTTQQAAYQAGLQRSAVIAKLNETFAPPTSPQTPSTDTE